MICLSLISWVWASIRQLLQACQVLRVRFRSASRSSPCSSRRPSTRTTASKRSPWLCSASNCARGSLRCTLWSGNTGNGRRGKWSVGGWRTWTLAAGSGFSENIYRCSHWYHLKLYLWGRNCTGRRRWPMGGKAPMAWHRSSARNRPRSSHLRVAQIFTPPVANETKAGLSPIACVSLKSLGWHAMTGTSTCRFCGRPMSCGTKQLQTTWLRLRWHNT